MSKHVPRLITSVLALAGVSAALAQTTPTLSAVEVRASAENLEGVASASSEGVVSAQRLAAVPVLRPGEALEMVPGLIVTQHAGDGKANQYFLRGFNLDHGTDFATWLDGMPLNMPSHAHGQGYTDLNPLIPELIERIDYRKGPYNAQDGDFASAGVAHIRSVRRLDAGLAQATLGAHGYTRTLLAGSPAAGAGQLLYALELFHNDGPWQVPEHYRKANGLLRYSQGSRDNGFALTGMAYHGRWTSTDQVAQRAVDSGLIGRFGSLDPTAGGRTSRTSLSGEWSTRDKDSHTRASAWWLQSGLDLWSNFQYCLNDIAVSGGCATGDQFEQSERRKAGGLVLSHTRVTRWGERDVVNSLGLQARTDRLNPVGLYQTSARVRGATVREDRVAQHSLGLWAQSEIRWSEHFRSVAGLRGDSYRFRVEAGLPANSGRARDALITPKLALVAGPWNKTELYLNAGHGFHSNDARGTTISVDPADPGTAVDKVQPLVRTRGVELGVRTEWCPGWQSTLAVWQLDTASELLFIGDAGTTEASRPSRRRGVEWTHFIAVTPWLALDADLAWSHARFRDSAPEGPYIPGAVTSTANLGVTVASLGPWSGALRLRRFGPRPLVEDNSVRSTGSTLVNLRLGYRISPRTQLTLDIYNLTNRKVNDIEYAYDSQLPGETAPVFDRHVHPTEPRSARLTLSHRF
jgi:outer membrane receptor protein involved in Fe transport